MIVLGFDTSTPSTVVGLRLADGAVLQARDDPAGGEHPGHATRLLPLANGLLREAGLEWDAITRIAVGVGPGTFTGLRIGVATARGLAQSLGVELAGVSSLRALAHAAGGCAVDETTAAIGASRAYGTGGAGRPDGVDDPVEVGDSVGMGDPAGVNDAVRVHDAVGVMALIDARRGELFAAAYEGDVELTAPRALAPGEMGQLLELAVARGNVEGWIAVGDGAARYREALELPRVFVPEEGSPLHRVDARAICELGARPSACPTGRVPTGNIGVLPDYRRRPDAEVALEGAAL